MIKAKKKYLKIELKHALEKTNKLLLRVLTIFLNGLREQNWLNLKNAILKKIQ